MSASLQVINGTANKIQCNIKQLELQHGYVCCFIFEVLTPVKKKNKHTILWENDYQMQTLTNFQNQENLCFLKLKYYDFTTVTAIGILSQIS